MVVMSQKRIHLFRSRRPRPFDKFDEIPGIQKYVHLCSSVPVNECLSNGTAYVKSISQDGASGSPILLLDEFVKSS
jgi:hypothetical protein